MNIKNDPTISVAMCTYQGGSFLAEQLESIQSQSVLPDEIVICDDASTDATVTILKAYLSSAPFDVRIVVNPTRRGVVRNFEKALSLCTGDYVLFADQDDVWSSHKIEILVRAARETVAGTEGVGSPAMFFSDLEVVGSSLERLHPSFFRSMRFHRKMIAFPPLLIENVVTGCASLVNRRLIEIALPFPNDAAIVGGHEWWLALCAAATGKLIFVDQPLVQYRQHGANAVGAGDRSPRTKIAAPAADIVPKSERALRKIDRAITRAKLVYERVTEHMPADRIAESAGDYARFATLPGPQRLALMLRSPVRRRTARKTAMMAMRMLRWSPTRR